MTKKAFYKLLLLTKTMDERFPSDYYYPTIELWAVYVERERKWTCGGGSYHSTPEEAVLGDMQGIGYYDDI